MKKEKNTWEKLLKERDGIIQNALVTKPHRKLLPHELAIEILERYHSRHVRLLVHQASSKDALQKTPVSTVSKE